MLTAARPDRRPWLKPTEAKIIVLGGSAALSAVDPPILAIMDGSGVGLLPRCASSCPVESGVRGPLGNRLSASASDRRRPTDGGRGPLDRGRSRRRRPHPGRRAGAAPWAGAGRRPHPGRRDRHAPSVYARCNPGEGWVARGRTEEASCEDIHGRNREATASPVRNRTEPKPAPVRVSAVQGPASTCGG